MKKKWAEREEEGEGGETDRKEQHRLVAGKQAIMKWVDMFKECCWAGLVWLLKCTAAILGQRDQEHQS